MALVTYDLMPVRLDRASSPSALTADAGRLLTNCDVMRLMRRLRRGPGFARMSAAPGTAAFRNLFVGVMGNGTRVAIVNTGTTAAGEVAPVASWTDTETAEEPEIGPDVGAGPTPSASPLIAEGWSKYTLSGGSGAPAFGDPPLVLEVPLSVPLTGRGLVIVDCNVEIQGTSGFDKGTATLEVYDSLNGWITLGVWVYEPMWNKMTCVLTPWNAGGSTFDSTLTKERWTLENNAGMVLGDLITFTASGFLYTARGRQV